MATHKQQIPIANVTGAGTSYKYISMKSWKYMVAQFTITGSCTVTMEASADDTTDDTDAALANFEWQDITSEAFGVSSLTATGSFHHSDPCAWKWLRMKYVSSGGATTETNVMVMD